jgi:adenine deaminase
VKDEVYSNPEVDLAKIAVFERHRRTGNVGLGFIKRLCLRAGAVASTVGYDSYNLVVAGVDDPSMVQAARSLITSGGGLIAVRDQEVLSHLPLPIAGLMSDQSVETVERQIAELKNAWTTLGCSLPSPTITLAFTTLSVIPELRITDDTDRVAANFGSNFTQLRKLKAKYDPSNTFRINQNIMGS